NYELLFDLGEYAEEGYWKITRIDLDDNAGNVNSNNYGEDGFTHNFYVENSKLDIKAPTINKITYPEKITIGDPFQIKINATDDISGIKLAYVVITSPSGKQRLTKIDYSADSDGNYELLFDLGEYAEEGYWKITRIDLDDNAGNVNSNNYGEDGFIHNFYVVDSKKKSVTLSTIQNPSYRVGNNIDLNAVSQGILNTEYRYFVRDENKQLTNLSQYSTDSILTWVPQKSGYYTVIAHAKSSQSPLDNYYYYEAKDEMNIYIKNPEISSVSTTVDIKSPQKLGKTIKIGATSVGGEDVNYRFYLRDLEGRLTLLRDYGKNNTVSWTPDKPGTYKIITHAKEEGTEGDKDFYEARDEITYKIEAEPISKVITNVDLASPQAVGKTITLNSSSIGGEKVNYRFYVRDKEGKLTLLKDYDGNNKATWTPDKPGTYKIITHAQEEGSNNKQYDARNESTYVVNPNLVSEVKTTVDVASPQTVGKTITLNSSSTGGEKVNYRFYVRDQEGKLALLKDYDDTNKITWTPDKPGTYKIITHAKEEGSNNKQYDARNEISYVVKANSLSKVTTLADALSPQKMGTTVTFKATAVGGEALEYRFFVRNEKGNLTLLRDYSPNNTVTWTPGSVGKYEVITHVKEASSKSNEFYYEQRSSLMYDVN
ncbi:hypothetical protein, partial [Terribacillus saccharophilus]|uniref:hypothetical protein n=1 Tax=Terribacillus saccharophilus TaxID=361277 RepID=UPI002989A726